MTRRVPVTRGRAVRSIRAEQNVVDAEDALASGDWLTAADIYSNLLKGDYFRAEAWYGIGLIALFADNDREQASECFSSALSEDAGHANSLYRLGEIAEARGDFATAAKRYQEVVSLSPNHYAARQRLARLGVQVQQEEPVAPPRAGLRQSPAAQRDVQRTTPQPPRAPKWPGSSVGIAGSIEVKRNIRKAELKFVLTTPGDEPRQLYVTMKCGSIQGGNLRAGDWVEVPPKAKRTGDGLQTKRLRNLSDGTELVCGQSDVVNYGLRQQFGMPRGYKF